MTSLSINVDFNHNNVNSPISKWEKVLYVLAIGGIIMPPAYLSFVQGFLLIHYLVMRYKRKKQPQQQVVRDSAIRHVTYHQIKQLLKLGVSGLFICTAIAGVLHMFVEPGSLSVSKELFAIANQCAKQGLYGLLLLIVLRDASRRGFDFLGLVKPFFWFFLGYILYMVLQRYTGVDWIKGWHATLPQNRFAYGVYRANGLIAHPLSLGYNLMLITIFATFLASHLPTKLRLWSYGIVALAIMGQILAGSRWPLVVSIVVLGLPSGRFLMRFWKGGLLGLGALMLFLRWEGQLWGRLQEIMQNGHSWEERIPRLVFWKIHTLIFWDHAWIGAGLSERTATAVDYYNRNGYNELESKYLAHNSFLQILADSGVIGFCGIALLLGCYLKIGSILRRYGKDGTLMSFFFASIGAALMQNNFHDTEYLYCFWFLSVLVLNLHLCRKPEDFRGENVAGNTK